MSFKAIIVATGREPETMFNAAAEAASRMAEGEADFDEEGVRGGGSWMYSVSATPDFDKYLLGIARFIPAPGETDRIGGADLASFLELQSGAEIVLYKSDGYELVLRASDRQFHWIHAEGTVLCSSATISIDPADEVENLRNLAKE